MKNILGILGAVSFVISGSLLGATIFSVMWLKNPKNIEEVKQKVIDDVMKGMNIPSVPSVTGGAVPKAAPSAGLSMPKF